MVNNTLHDLHQPITSCLISALLSDNHSQLISPGCHWLLVGCFQQQGILKLAMGTNLVKVDLQNAYRIIQVHPHDQHLLAVQWEGQIFVDRALPFGLCSAPKIFSAVADMIAWALHQAGIKHLVHYLDDFLFLHVHSQDGGRGTGPGTGSQDFRLPGDSSCRPQN